MPHRTTGFYWIKRISFGDILPAVWTGNFWYIPGCYVGYSDHEFKEICEIKPPPHPEATIINLETK